MTARAELEAAQDRGMALFDAIERARLVRPGRSEREVDADIHALAERDFGITVNWHRRVVRAGPNTIHTFYDDPPLHVIGPEDTVYVDLGPVFAEWEADIGRTYAMGADPEKRRLVADLPRLFEAVKAHYHASPDITGAALYAFAQRAAEDAGWLFGGVIAGHIVGEFPHVQRVPGDRDLHRIAPKNPKRMRDPDDNGNARHWILETHLVDKARTFGGFYQRQFHRIMGVSPQRYRDDRRLQVAVELLYEASRPDPTAKRPLFTDFAPRLLVTHPAEVKIAHAPLLALLTELMDAASDAGALRATINPKRVAAMTMLCGRDSR